MADLISKYRGGFIKAFNELVDNRMQACKDKKTELFQNLYKPKSMLIYGFIVILSTVVKAPKENYNIAGHLLIAIGLICMVVCIKIYFASKEYQNFSQDKLLSRLLDVFGNFTYMPSPVGFLSMESLLPDVRKTKFIIPYTVYLRSKLYTKNINYNQNGDGLVGNYNGIEFQMCETDFGKKERNIPPSYSRMFRGIALHFEVNLNLGTMIISNSQNNELKIPEGFKKFKIKNPKYINKFDIWMEQTDSDNITDEIKRILETTFLDKLNYFQRYYKVKKIECSISDNSVVILMPTGDDLFNMGSIFSNVEDIKNYDNLFYKIISVLDFMDFLNILPKKIDN